MEGVMSLILLSCFIIFSVYILLGWIRHLIFLKYRGDNIDCLLALKHYPVSYYILSNEKYSKFEEARFCIMIHAMWPLLSLYPLTPIQPDPGDNIDENIDILPPLNQRL